MSIDSSVAQSSEDIFSLILVPSGAHVVLTEFGGCVPFIKDGSYIAIQWGKTGDWKTIRAIAREGTYVIKKEFIGDGTRTFRIIRKNTDTVARVMLVWITGYIR